ncbi:MAG: hypothetical protein IPI07_19615 [Flavobacteriales bacterium]|nr:hypothetical protein [Flavobacteriales bacterium]
MARNLTYEDRDVLVIDPRPGLPSQGQCQHRVHLRQAGPLLRCLNNYNHFVTSAHVPTWGISLEEMMVPVVTLKAPLTDEHNPCHGKRR